MHGKCGFPECVPAVVRQKLFGALFRIIENFAEDIICRSFESEQFPETAPVNSFDLIPHEKPDLFRTESGACFRRQSAGVVLTPVVKIDAESLRDFDFPPCVERFRRTVSEFNHDVFRKFMKCLRRPARRRVGDQHQLFARTVFPPFPGEESRVFRLDRKHCRKPGRRRIRMGHSRP